MAATRTQAPLLRIETSSGAAAWRALQWDTHQFGISAARLEALDASGFYREARAEKSTLLALVLNECHSAGVRYLTARVDAGDLTSIHSLEEAGFELIDGIQTFLLSINGNHSSPPPDARLFRPSDMTDVLEIARTAFVFDRFHADPSLAPEVADRVNEDWTRNCCLGAAADAVLVAEEEGCVVSYVTCRIDRGARHGVVILVATAPAARGKGAGRRASAAALHWFSNQGAATVEVGTQLRNVPAARLYESLGFRMHRTSLTFRKLL